jgi:hypothetical protein
VQQSQFDSAVSDLEQALRPQAARILYRLDDDATGEPAVFFMILLPDEAASPRYELRSVTNRISTEIDRRIEPMDQWGVIPYFSFRTVSEHAQLKEPAWA